MNIQDHIIVSIMSLKSNLFRTFLTMLGIIIGVMSIVTLLSLGKGIQASIESSFNAFGSNTIYSVIGNEETNFGSGPPGSNGGFTAKEIDRVISLPKKYLVGVASVTQSFFKVSSSEGDENLQVVGYYGDFEEVFDIEIEKGKMLSKSDIQSGNKVALIGPDLVDKLFDGKNPLGEEIKIKGNNFTVIGIVKEKGGSSLDNPDEYITVPYRTYNRYLISADEFPLIALKAKNQDYIEEAKEEAKKLIRKARNLSSNQENDFRIRDAGELLDTINQVTGFFTTFLAAIAAISLLVGGIGVMNIMFVSITERTKEIGLRKSIGAKNSDIMMQFLTESTLVTIFGGAIGISLGLTISYIASIQLGLSTELQWDAIGLGLIFSIVIGLIFGIYPARKASKLNPIDALRYE